MNKFKKIVLGTTSASAIVAPIAGVISCGSSDEDSVIILSGKTQIQHDGEVFASKFDSSKIGKVDGAPSATHFTSANGDSIVTRLNTRFGSKSFPAVFGLAGGTEVSPYVQNGSALQFDDPKYDEYGKATVQGAEEKNKNLAGSKINDLIKAAEMQGQPILMKDKKIIGLPSFSEAIGIIYNKTVFKKGGIKKVVQGPEPSSNSDSVINESGAVRIDEQHGTLYTDTLTKNAYINLKKEINDKKDKWGVEGAQGIVTKGKESWAFTSKIGTIATIGRAAEKAGKTIGNPQVPGGTSAKGELTPTKAKELFNGEGKEGIKVYKDAAELYLKDTKTYTTNNDMMDALQGEHIAMMPQGTWEEGYLNKTSGIQYGFLPLSMGLKDGDKPYYSKDIVGYWIFSDQQKAAGRSKTNAVAVQTKAANFIWDLYLGEGRKSYAESMGLLNPYDTTIAPNESTHPLLADVSAIAEIDHSNSRISRWGSAYNLPGTGGTGFERNNLQYTKLVAAYQSNSTPATLKNLTKKVIDIWAHSGN